MMRFKLLAGFHAHGKNEDGTAKVYSPGDIIETDTDLAARLGKNKFERLHDELVKVVEVTPSKSWQESSPVIHEGPVQEKPQRRRQ